MRVYGWCSLLLLLLPSSVGAQTTLRVPVSVDRSLSHVQGASVPLTGGDMLLAVDFDGPAVLGGRSLDEPGRYGNTLLARVDSAGMPFWHRVFRGSNTSTHVSSMVPTPDGGALISGHLPGPVVISIGSDGQERWRLPILDNDGTDLQLIATPQGTTLLRGSYFRGPVRIAGHRFAGPRRFNTFLAEVDPQGQVQWARRIPGDALAYMVVSPDGTLTTAGQFRHPFRHGRRILRSNGDWDIAVQRFSARGQPLGAFTMGGRGADTLSGLHVYDTGDLALLTTQPPAQGIPREQQLVGLDPSGNVLFSRRLAGRSARIAEGQPGPLALVVQPIGEERLTHAAEHPRESPELGPVSRGETLYSRSLEITQVSARGAATRLPAISQPGYAIHCILDRVLRFGTQLHVGTNMALVRPDGQAGTVEAVSFIRPLSAPSVVSPWRSAGLASTPPAPGPTELVRWR
ncbi:MAG: hypothetical protein AB8I08_03595 [Sandaracinaceae bacterium]